MWVINFQIKAMIEFVMKCFLSFDSEGLEIAVYTEIDHES